MSTSAYCSRVPLSACVRRVVAALTILWSLGPERGSDEQAVRPSAAMTRTAGLSTGNLPGNAELETVMRPARGLASQGVDPRGGAGVRGAGGQGARSWRG